MMNPSDPRFSEFDEKTETSRGYFLPLERWNEMVRLANHLGQREAEEPLRRRMASFLTASNQAYSSRR